ncbi:MAG TPA: xanthine phosphoribosyltransferase [Candidatus Obscuribacterales bacterium]
MKLLEQIITQQGKHLGNGILKVDSFMNHQIDPNLMVEIGAEFSRAFFDSGVTRILTAETSGIAPALAAGMSLRVPVVFARKKKPVTMQDPLTESAPSHTKGGMVDLSVSSEYLLSGDRIVIIDDFLASAQTIVALAKLVKQTGAELVGIGAVIEKIYSGGRALLEPFNVPIHSLARIEGFEGEKILLASATSPR